MGQKLSEDHIYAQRSDAKVTKLNEDHLLPSKVKRYKRGHTFAERAQSALFNNADDVLDEVYVDICNGERWTYKDGALDRLHQRWSAEFGILWFLMMFKMNGSAPIDVALLKPSDCKMVSIGGEDYWSIDIRRRKTARDVHIRLKRDLLVIIGLEHFMGFSSGHYVYPIINWKEKMSDRYFIEQCHHCSSKAIKHIKEAFMRINEDIARDNAVKGSNESLVDLSRLVMYTARHSFASQYLSSPNATVNGLASLMARSANTIATYVHQLTKDEEIAAMVDGMAI